MKHFSHKCFDKKNSILSTIGDTLDRKFIGTKHTTSKLQIEEAGGGGAFDALEEKTHDPERRVHFQTWTEIDRG
jgi:hypothetical protein